MITKNDLILLLTEMEEDGNVDARVQIRNLLSKSDLSLDVLKFINDRRTFDVANFYEKIRKSYNNKKSDLYINIVKEVEDPRSVLTTLASLNLQILLFSKNVENPEMFYKHVRAEELTRVLHNYYKTYDLTSCINLLRLFKADIKCFESIKG